MQFVDAAHQCQISIRHWAWLVVRRGAGYFQYLALLCNRELVVWGDHLFALSNPALVSAPSKKSFSSVSCPILACSTLISGWAGCRLAAPPPNTSAARSCICCFHSTIWLACRSNSCANSASVLSPFKAANATLALNPAA